MPRNKESKARYDVEYIRAHDNIMIRPSKEEGARIRAAAAAAGMSVQGYILFILREHLPPETGEGGEPAEIGNLPDNQQHQG